MKKFLLIAVAIVLIGGGLFSYGRLSSKPEQVPSSQPVPGNSNITGNVQACIGTAEYCRMLAEAKQKEIENAQKQFELVMEAANPTPIPESPEAKALREQEEKSRSTWLVTTLWVALVFAVLAGLAWLTYQIYWWFRVKIPKDEVAPDIRQKDGLIVAKLKGDLDHADARDQYVVVDVRAFGTQMVHIDGNGIAHQIAVTDEVGKYLAMSHAVRDAGAKDQARATLEKLLNMWTDSTTKQISAVSSAAANWKATGKTPAADKSVSEQSNITETWT